MKMDDGLPIVGPTVDLSQAPPINSKRTLAFINHFITNTVRFLNKFSCACEEKLAEIHVRVQRLEITLSILEAKLSSIPGLDQVASPATAKEERSSEVQTENAKPIETVENVESVSSISDVPELTVSKDPRYAKYFKMVNVGVPLPAVKVKMAAEGLDPDLLDTPDAPAPPNLPAEKNSNGASDSDESFSDESFSTEDDD